MEFCSLPPSYRDARVPPGLQYYTLKAQLSGIGPVGGKMQFDHLGCLVALQTFFLLSCTAAELQLVFLYRFLQENLTYLSSMLAMRLSPLEPPGTAVATPTTESMGGSASPTKSAGSVPVPVPVAGRPPLQPFVLLMDVQANAPVICLPRNSGAGEPSMSSFNCLSIVLHRSPVPLAAPQTSALRPHAHVCRQPGQHRGRPWGAEPAHHWHRSPAADAGGRCRPPAGAAGGVGGPALLRCVYCVSLRRCIATRLQAGWR